MGGMAKDMEALVKKFGGPSTSKTSFKAAAASKLKALKAKPKGKVAAKKPATKTKKAEKKTKKEKKAKGAAAKGKAKKALPKTSVKKIKGKTMKRKPRKKKVRGKKVRQLTGLFVACRTLMYANAKLRKRKKKENIEDSNLIFVLIVF